MNANHLRVFIVRPALNELEMWSPAAENLILGTAAVESDLEYLAQISGGPGLGLWQIEPQTHEDVWANFLKFRKPLAKRVVQAAGRGTQTPRLPPHDWLIYNLRYAAAVARVIYWRDPEPLPEPTDTAGLGEYWKRVYNTDLGAGTVKRFVASYERLVAV